MPPSRATSGSFLRAERGELWPEDYATMLPTGMLLDDDEPFDTVMQRCALIEERANAAWVTDQ